MTARLVRLTTQWLKDAEQALMPSSKLVAFRKAHVSHTVGVGPHAGSQQNIDLGLPVVPTWLYVLPHGETHSRDFTLALKSAYRGVQEWPVQCACGYVMSFEELTLMGYGSCTTCGAEVFSRAELESLSVLVSLGDLHAWLIFVFNRLRGDW